jgi:hypothetical protein
MDVVNGFTGPRKLQTFSHNDFMPLVETLPAERFKLAAHRETNEMAGLALVVDPKGMRTQPVEAGAGGFASTPYMVRGTKITMDQFAFGLSSSQNRPVKNPTLARRLQHPDSLDSGSTSGGRAERFAGIGRCRRPETRIAIAGAESAGRSLGIGPRRAIAH